MSFKVFRAGMVVAVGVATLLGVGACSLLAPAYRDASGQVTATASVGITSLKTGDCIYDVSNMPDPITKVQVVPCSAQHEGEVFATESNVANVADDIVNFCIDQFASYVGIGFNDSQLTAKYFGSDVSSANTDVQCIVFMPGQMVSQSYKGSQQ